MDKIKMALAAISGALLTFVQAYAVTYIAVISVIVLDVVTGLIKAKMSEAGIDSTTARKGFWGKIGLLVALTFGVFLDIVIPSALMRVGSGVDINLPFAMITGAYIVINESISICENLYIINPKAIPSFLAKILKVARDNMDKEDDDDDEDNA